MKLYKLQFTIQTPDARGTLVQEIRAESEGQAVFRALRDDKTLLNGRFQFAGATIAEDYSDAFGEPVRVEAVEDLRDTTPSEVAALNAGLQMLNRAMAH